MKAAVFLGNEKIEVREVPVPVPPPGEVLVKVRACGVCGTDVHLYEGTALGATPPVALGHEITGTVAGLGQGVNDLTEEETVCIDPVVGCGICRFCRRGRTNLCENYRIIGYARWGGFAEYLVAPRTHVHRIAPHVSAAGGILAETLACVLNGYNRLEIEPGSSVLLVGAGTVGLLWNNLITHSCVAELVQVDVIEERATLARELGADRVWCTGHPDGIADFKKEYQGDFDLVVDCSGTPDGILLGMEHIRAGGTFMVFGVCDKNVTIPISPFDLFNKELRIIAAKMPPRTLAQAIRLIEAGVIDSDRIVTSTWGLEDVESCLHRFVHNKDQDIKMSIDPSHGRG
ncbi:MAG TPA: alcohol dehydrogenase catalytic domain-containing protein [bacterium]|nr:alcohol dehydrogenase catalytic domain-containing protein [bacterium]